MIRNKGDLQRRVWGGALGESSAVVCRYKDRMRVRRGREREGKGREREGEEGKGERGRGGEGREID